MGRVIGFIAVKGGVGKTSVSASVASSLVNYFGKKVLLVDGNYSAPNLGLHMDIVSPGKTIHDVLDGRVMLKSAIHERFGVDVVPGSYVYPGKVNSLKLRNKLDSLKEDYDFVVLDSSPNLNDEVLSTILASDNLFVVTTPDYPTFSCSLSAARLARKRGRRISGIVLNKIRDPRYELSLKELERGLEMPVVAKIPDDVKALRAVYSRIPISVFDKRAGFSKEVERFCRALVGEKSRWGFLKKLVGGDFGKEEVNRDRLRREFYG